MQEKRLELFLWAQESLDRVVAGESAGHDEHRREAKGGDQIEALVRLPTKRELLVERAGLENADCQQDELDGRRHDRKGVCANLHMSKRRQAKEANDVADSSIIATRYLADGMGAMINAIVKVSTARAASGSWVTK